MWAQSLVSSWYGASRVKWWLIPLSWLFWLLITFRHFLYQQGFIRSFRLPVPVIVIGNVTVGGTGKTPLVIALSHWLKEQGYQVGIVSRGYQGQIAEGVHLLQRGDQAQVVGDEPLLLFEQTGCPVAIGRDRSLAAQRLIETHPQINILLSDDGLQHYRLQRDIEIAVVDSQRLVGNGHLLPTGPLREPVTRLSSVDAIVTNGQSSQNFNHPHQFVMRLLPHQWLNVREPQQSLPLDAMTQGTYHALCAIGNPQRFFDTLSQMGIRLEQTLSFPDHYPYGIEDFAGFSNEKILMTEKDGIKCREIAPPSSWMLSLSVQLESEFYSWLMGRLAMLEKK